MNHEVDPRFVVPKLQALLLERAQRIFDLEHQLALRDAAIDQLTQPVTVEPEEAVE